MRTIPAVGVSTQELVHAFNVVKTSLNPNYLKLLGLLYSAGKNGLTATEAATKLEYAGFQGANAAVGAIGKKLLAELSVEWVNHIGRGFMPSSLYLDMRKENESKGEHWRWTLCKEAREAIQQLKMFL